MRRVWHGQALPQQDLDHALAHADVTGTLQALHSAAAAALRKWWRTHASTRPPIHPGRPAQPTQAGTHLCCCQDAIQDIRLCGGLAALASPRRAPLPDDVNDVAVELQAGRQAGRDEEAGRQGRGEEKVRNDSCVAEGRGGARSRQAGRARPDGCNGECRSC